jgi:hypothetical protein
MRLIRLLVTLTVLAGVAFVAFTVPLGERTLWGHLKAIAGSRESQELVDGVKQKAREVVGPDAGPARYEAGAGSDDKLTAEERRLLRKLIREKLARDKKPPSKKK